MVPHHNHLPAFPRSRRLVKMPEEVDSHVLLKYEIVERLGKGAYGVVWKAIEKSSGLPVALKKIFAAFQNVTDAQRTFREIMFLQELSDHPSIIKLQNVMKAENDHDIYLVFEFMETDLHRVICANILEDIHIQFTMHQLFKCLKYIHSAGMIHRDLKPSNVLLDRKCNVKVADFGLARSVAMLEQEDVQPIMTDYVATRWYRSPEMLLGSTKYTYGIDMWSSGCILGELLLGKPLFRGSSTKEQIDMIIGFTGKPLQADVDSVQSRFAAMLIESIPKKPRPVLRELFPTASPEALDLLKKLLEFNPRKRITAQEALQHPYIAKFHDPEEELPCNRIIRIPISDNKRQSVNEYREALYAAIVKHKKDMRKLHRERRRQNRIRRSDGTREGVETDFEQRATQREVVNARNPYPEQANTPSTASSQVSSSQGASSNSKYRDTATRRVTSSRGDFTTSRNDPSLRPGNQACLPNVGCLEIATCMLAPAMCVWGTWLWLYANNCGSGAI